MAVTGFVIDVSATVIGSLVLAGFLNLAWLAMGSRKGHGNAYRCNACLAAIFPALALTGFISYLNLVEILRGLNLVVAARVEVHGLPARSAWVVFGLIALPWRCNLSVPGTPCGRRAPARRWRGVDVGRWGGPKADRMTIGPRHSRI